MYVHSKNRVALENTSNVKHKIDSENFLFQNCHRKIYHQNLALFHANLFQVPCEKVVRIA